METKKVIEQGVSFLDITHLTKTISIYEKFHSRPEGKTILVAKSNATEVAKAICPKYQELENQNAKLLDALNRLLEYGDRIVELYRDSVEKIKSDDTKKEDLKTFQLRLAQGKFYGWRDSMKFLREAIQQSETKSKDNE